MLLNLPVQILEKVDMAVREQGVTRSQFLRQAIERNLRHYQRVERAIFCSHLSGGHELGLVSQTWEPRMIQCPLIA